MDDPTSLPIAESLEMKCETNPEINSVSNEKTKNNQKSLKSSISNESHLAEEIYTFRRIIFVFYLFIYLILIPWLLF